MQLPQRYTAKVTNKILLSWKVTKLTLEVIEPTELMFEPGQFVSLKIEDSCYRAYSICSDPKITKSLSLIIETGHDGKGSNFTKALKVNDTIFFIGPSGRYKVRQPYEKNICFLATGTGIAPFVPMIYKLINYNYNGSVRLFQGFRNDKDVFFIDLFDFFKSKLNDFDYKIFISQNTSDPKFLNGMINDDLTKIFNPDTQYYICGHPSMVAETKKSLSDMGVDSGKILTEEFSRSDRK